MQNYKRFQMLGLSRYCVPKIMKTLVQVSSNCRRWCSGH